MDLEKEEIMRLAIANLHAAELDLYAAHQHIVNHEYRLAVAALQQADLDMHSAVEALEEADDEPHD